MKKAKKRLYLNRLWAGLKGISLSFLAAVFLFGFLMSHDAHTLAERQKAYAAGYALCVYKGPPKPSPEQTVLLLPNGALEATSLEQHEWHKM